MNNLVYFTNVKFRNYLQVTEALQLYNKYGAPPNPQNFNIYKRIAVDLFALPYDEEHLGGGNYFVWAGLRELLIFAHHLFKYGRIYFGEFLFKYLKSIFLK